MNSLTELQQRITAKVPQAYVEYVNSRPLVELCEQGMDPKTLLVLNLELMALDEFADSKGWFFLTGDGCGNYTYVDTSVDEQRVLLWSHDPIETVDLKESLESFLLDALQVSRIDCVPSPSRLYLCRTKSHCEAILDPITLSEWIAIADETPEVRHVGYRTATNPFTGEQDRFDIPGFAIVRGDDESTTATWFNGAVIFDDAPTARRIATQIAERLNARLITSV